MAIDIRANVTCNLGTLISATLSDDYIQGNGLIKTSGSCEISGLITPAPGDVVTFSYTKGGITRHVPRKMRVLSSFTDPFRRTTSVELGCKLTYLQDIAPLYDENSKQSAKQLQCLNEYSGYSKDTELPIPFKASEIMQFCLTKLGLTASHNPLTNVFYREDGFDYSDGYVNVLSDLLLSESYCGYLDYDETLQIFSLDQMGGSGPLIAQDKIIDVAKIGVGPLPGDAVIVRYNSLTFNAEENSEPTTVPQVERNWTSDESRGPKEITIIPYVHPNFGDQRIATVEVEQYSSTITEFGQDNSWDEDTCVIRSTTGELPDLSDSAIRRRTFQLAVKGVDAAAHCGFLLSEGVDPNLGLGAFIETITEFEYNQEGKEIRQRTVTKEPYFTFAGKTQLQFVVNEPQGQRFLLSWGAAMVTTQIEEVETEYTYASAPTVLRLKKNEKFIPEENGRKVYRNVWTVWPHTAEGQQALAWMNENAPYTNTEALQGYYEQIARIMVKTESSVQTSSGRLVVGGQVRPKLYTIQLQERGGQRGEQTSEVVYATGNSSAERIIEFSMPYQSDDYLTGGNVVARGDAGQKALVFGRVQNKLLLGNRSGMNLQVAPEILPDAPFRAFFLEANGLSALYRTNGTSWTMDNSGIVVSTDALFWGGVGGTGNFWFPVAPGIVSLPSTPPAVDTSPDQVIGTIETVGTAPQTALNAAFPSAVDGDGVQDEATNNFWVYDGALWNNVGTTPGPTIQVSTVVPPWNEIVKTDATVRTTLEVTSVNYALVVSTAIEPFESYYNLNVRKLTIVKIPETSINIDSAIPAISTGFSAAIQAIAIELTVDEILISIGNAISPPVVEFTITPLEPYQTGPSFTGIEVEAIDVNLIAIDPIVSTGKNISVNFIELILNALIPLASTGASLKPEPVAINIQVLLPEQTGPDPIKVLAPAANITVNLLAPEISTGLSVLVESSNIALQAIVPDIIIDEYFLSMLAQVYAWDREFRVDWWGD